MKTNFIVIILLISIIFSCDKNDLEFQNTRGSKLLSITYKEGNREGSLWNWSELFNYNNSGNLMEINQTRWEGRNYQLIYDGNNQLQEYTTYINETNELVSRDSITYNQNGTIKAVYSFSKISNDNLSLSTIYEYEYTNEGKLSNKKSYSFSVDKSLTSIEKYFWNSTNINRVEYYDPTDRLLYEVNLTYDTNNNFKKNNPIHLIDPTVYGSENNLIKTSLKDYTGALNLVCNPCKTKYIYNLDNYPVSVIYDWGLQLTIEYE